MPVHYNMPVSARILNGESRNQYVSRMMNFSRRGLGAMVPKRNSESWNEAYGKFYNDQRGVGGRRSYRKKRTTRRSRKTCRKRN